MIRGLIDHNDLAHVRRMGLNPVVAEPCPLGGNGVINPHVTRFYTLDGKITDVFHIKPVYYEAIDHSWRPMSEVAVHHGNKNIVLKMGWGRMMSQRYFQWLTKRQRLFKWKDLAIEGLVLQPAYYEYATDSTFYPDPHTETTTCDGWVQGYNTTSWASVRALSSGNEVLDNADGHQYQGEKIPASLWIIVRNFFLFDTSAIADGDTVSAATLSLYKNSTAGDTTEATYKPNICIVTTTPASNTGLVLGDFDQVGSTKLSDTDYSIMTFEGNKSQYHNITLNATGLGAISKTGVTKLGQRPSNDFSDSTAPTNRHYSYGSSAEVAGTTQDPKLVVTHAASASGPASLKTWNTVAKASVKTRNGVALASIKSANTIT